MLKLGPARSKIWSSSARSTTFPKSSSSLGSPKSRLVPSLFLCEIGPRHNRNIFQWNSKHEKQGGGVLAGRNRPMRHQNRYSDYNYSILRFCVFILWEWNKLQLYLPAGGTILRVRSAVLLYVHSTNLAGTWNNAYSYVLTSWQLMVKFLLVFIVMMTDCVGSQWYCCLIRVSSKQLDSNLSRELYCTQVKLP